MRNLNPMLYEVLWDWYRKLTPEYNIGEFIDNRNNLKSTKGEIVAGLIHQFPKSYVEAYEVYSDLFRQLDVFSVYDNLDEINILSLATGSGGDVFGLVQALETYFTRKRINIFTVEGNKDALRSQVNIFKHHIERSLIHNEIKIIPIALVIEADLSNLWREINEKCFEKYGFERFDIIQSSKWMTEESIRSQFRFYNFYRLINQWLAPNRVATLLERVDPFNGFEFEHQLPKLAMDDFVLFCNQNRQNNQLVALTPTPCIARRINGLYSKQCQGCTYCYDEFETFCRLPNQKRYTWEKSYAFVMKFATAQLAKLMTDQLQDEDIDYLTVPYREGEPERFCNLNTQVEATKQENAFRLSNPK